MLKKEELQSKGFEIIDTTDNLAKSQQQKIDAIKNIIPDLISSDCQLNTNKLQEILGIKNLTKNYNGYELQFLGKPLARAKAYQDTKYELKTEKEISKNFDTTSNIVIKGDNIDVLKILKQNYQNKIKMIYIDPPYNTGNDGFIYQDNFKDSEQELCEKFHLQEDIYIDLLTDVYKTTAHSSWLSFIYPRLLLARELLTEDGCIFISIDDNEQANLKIICDEIFGESNFVTNFIWKKRTVKNDAPNGISTDTESILCYSKNGSSFIGGRDFEKKYYKTNDFDDEWRLNPFTKHNTASERPNSNFTVINPKNGQKWDANPNRVWCLTKDTFPDYYKAGKVVFPGDYDFLNISSPMLRIFKQEDKNKKGDNFNRASVSNYFDMQLVGGTGDGTKLINDLFHSKVFPFPKPIALIQKLCEIINLSDNDIILDFFAGSGTTGHAVMELNKQDGGNRKFILVQKDEKIDEKSESYKFCEANNLKPVISSITIERLNRAGQKLIDKELDISNLDSGYKVFSLIKKPKLTQANQQIHIEYINKESLDIFFNMLAKTDKPLTTSYTKITENLFLVTNPNNSQEEILYITDFKETDIQNFKKYQPTKIYLNGYANIELHNFLSFFTKENTKIIY